MRSPEQRMFLNVITQAVHDAAYKGVDRYYQYHRDKNVYWLTGNYRDFKIKILITNKDIFKDMTYNTLNKQVDGNHYKDMKVEPAYFINENNLPYAEGNAIKYICRHKKKSQT